MITLMSLGIHVSLPWFHNAFLHTLSCMWYLNKYNSALLSKEMHTLSIHFGDVIISVMASQITSLTVVYSTVYSGTYRRKHQSSASLALVRGIHRWPMNFPHKGPVTRIMFPFDGVIVLEGNLSNRRDSCCKRWWPPRVTHILIKTFWILF